MQQLIKQSMAETQATIAMAQADAALIDAAAHAAHACIQALQSGKKILLCGNGGSAADAQHIAAELVSRFNYDRPGLPAVALTTDSSALTAIGNDYGYEKLFARQLEALGQAGDVLIAISTSGNSPNVLKALECAKAKGIASIGLTGASGGKMAPQCDIALRMPSSSTPRIQECHIMFGHILCQLIEDHFFKDTHGPR